VISPLISPLILISSYSIAIATELIKITILASSIFVSPSIFISISITSVVFHALLLVFSTRCRSRASNGLVGVVIGGLE
jgi:hypothetical protein